MKLEDINIRDPFVLNDGGIYYLYGTRAKDFGCHTGGFDVRLIGRPKCINTKVNTICLQPLRRKTD